ncbi:MAG: outer membrane beta-barrel protein [Sediminibacterium sp.]
MYNLGDDNELDRASREAAGRYSPPGDPDWQALSAELDKVLPVEEKKRRVFFFWWLLPVLLIGGGATYWLMQKENVPVEATAATPVTKQSGSKETKTISPTESAVSEQKETSTPAITPTEKQIPSAQLTNPEAKKNLVRIDERAAASGSGILSVNTRKTKTASVSTPSKVVKEEPASTTVVSKTTEQPTKQDPPVITVTITKSTAEPVKDQANTNDDQTAQQVKDNNTPVTENKTQPIPQAVQQQPSETKSPETSTKLQQRGKGFSFGILAGIDKSTVKFTYDHSPGYNMGFLTGYHFSDRWSVHTGVIYTQKNYKLAGADFTAPKGSWASYYKIDNVEGYCRMWEIPVLARYTISQNSNRNVFLSTGLSSYFMTSENYDYAYYTNAGLLATRNTAYNSADTHIMSILHLSVGFENRISRSWSLQVEPYAKIPMGGVGFGNIRLSSFGLNFSVQQRQPAKK